jgi:hypothetical protein
MTALLTLSSALLMVYLTKAPLAAAVVWFIFWNNIVANLHFFKKDMIKEK